MSICRVLYGALFRRRSPWGNIRTPIRGRDGRVGGVGPVLMGYAFDKLGTYGPMLFVFQIALLLAVLSVAALRPYTFPARRSLA